MCFHHSLANNKVGMPPIETPQNLYKGFWSKCIAARARRPAPFHFVC